MIIVIALKTISDKVHSLTVRRSRPRRFPGHYKVRMAAMFLEHGGFAFVDTNKTAVLTGSADRRRLSRLEVLIGRDSYKKSIGKYWRGFKPGRRGGCQPPTWGRLAQQYLGQDHTNYDEHPDASPAEAVGEDDSEPR